MNTIKTSANAFFTQGDLLFSYTDYYGDIQTKPVQHIKQGLKYILKVEDFYSGLQMELFWDEDVQKYKGSYRYEVEEGGRIIDKVAGDINFYLSKDSSSLIGHPSHRHDLVDWKITVLGH